MFSTGGYTRFIIFMLKLGDTILYLNSAYSTLFHICGCCRFVDFVAVELK